MTFTISSWTQFQQILFNCVYSHLGTLNNGNLGSITFLKGQTQDSDFSDEAYKLALEVYTFVNDESARIGAHVKNLIDSRAQDGSITDNIQKRIRSCAVLIEMPKQTITPPWEEYEFESESEPEQPPEPEPEQPPEPEPKQHPEPEHELQPEPEPEPEPEQQPEPQANAKAKPKAKAKAKPKAKPKARAPEQPQESEMPFTVVKPRKEHQFSHSTEQEVSSMHGRTAYTPLPDSLKARLSQEADRAQLDQQSRIVQQQLPQQSDFPALSTSQTEIPTRVQTSQWNNRASAGTILDVLRNYHNIHVSAVASTHVPATRLHMPGKNVYLPNLQGTSVYRLFLSAISTLATLQGNNSLNEYTSDTKNTNNCIKVAMKFLIGWQVTQDFIDVLIRSLNPNQTTWEATNAFIDGLWKMTTLNGVHVGDATKQVKMELLALRERHGIPPVRF